MLYDARLHVCPKLQNRTLSDVRDKHKYDCIPTIRHAGVNHLKYWNQNSSNSNHDRTWTSHDVVMFVEIDVNIWTSTDPHDVERILMLLDNSSSAALLSALKAAHLDDLDSGTLRYQICICGLHLLVRGTRCPSIFLTTSVK